MKKSFQQKKRGKEKEDEDASDNVTDFRGLFCVFAHVCDEFFRLTSVLLRVFERQATPLSGEQGSTRAIERPVSAILCWASPSPAEGAAFG